MNITEDKAKGLVILGAAGLAAYAVWRAYKVAKSASDQVQASIGGAVDAVSNTVDGVASLYHSAVNSTLGAIGALPSNGSYPEARPIRPPISDAAVDAINAQAAKVVANNAAAEIAADPMYQTNGGGEFATGSYGVENPTLYQARQVGTPVDVFMLDNQGVTQ